MFSLIHHVCDWFCEYFRVEDSYLLATMDHSQNWSDTSNKYQNSSRGKIIAHRVHKIFQSLLVLFDIFCLSVFIDFAALLMPQQQWLISTCINVKDVFVELPISQDFDKQNRAIWNSPKQWNMASIFALWMQLLSCECYVFTWLMKFFIVVNEMLELR